MTSDIYLFQKGLAVKVVAISIWDSDTKAMVEALNATLTEEQKKDGYTYIAIKRGEGKDECFSENRG